MKTNTESANNQEKSALKKPSFFLHQYGQNLGSESLICFFTFIGLKSLEKNSGVFFSSENAQLTTRKLSFNHTVGSCRS